MERKQKIQKAVRFIEELVALLGYEILNFERCASVFLQRVSDLSILYRR